MADDNKRKVLGLWGNRISDAIRRRDDFAEGWDENIRQLLARELDENSRSEANVVGNDATDDREYSYSYKLRSYMRIELPRLVPHFPYFYFTAVAGSGNPQIDTQIKRAEVAVNRHLREVKELEVETKASVVDGHTHSVGIASTFYEPKIKPHKQAGKPMMGKDSMMQMVDPKTNKPMVYPENEDIGGRYHTVRVNPKKLLVPEKADHSTERLPWIGFEFEKTLTEIENNPNYDKKTVRYISDLQASKVEIEGEKADIFIQLVEIYDCENQELLVMEKDSSERFLRKTAIPKGIGPHPYSVLRFDLEPGEFWNPAYFDSSTPLIKEFTGLRKVQKDWSQAVRPILGVKPSMKPEEVNKLRDGESDVVMTNPGDVNPINWGDVPQTIFTHGDKLEREVDESLVQSRQERGQVGDAKFAEEVKVASGNSQLASQDKSALVRTFYEDICRKHIKLMQAHLPESYSRDVMIDQQGEGEVQDRFILADLDADVDIDIDLTSKTEKNMQVEKQQFIEAVTFIVGNPIILQFPSLMNEFLDKFEIKNRQNFLQEAEQYIQGQSQGGAQQAQAEMEMELAKIKAKGEIDIEIERLKQSTPPKANVSVSFKAEEMPEPIQAEILNNSYGRGAGTGDVPDMGDMGEPPLKPPPFAPPTDEGTF